VKPAAVLFDAGGTLVLQDPTSLAELLHHDVSAELAYEAHYRAMDAYARRRLDGDEISWAWWQEHYFTGLGYPQPAQGALLTNDGYGLWSAAIPGTALALDVLRESGVRLAVVSNSDGSVRGSLERAGLLDRFEFVVDSYEVGVAKPEPEIFHVALRRMDVEPALAWYVGDSIYHDIGGAQRAGLAVAVLIDPFDLAQEHSPRIRSVADLPSMIEGSQARGLADQPVRRLS
jgi:putative hydrolase of the HAD superfamily